MKHSPAYSIRLELVMATEYSEYCSGFAIQSNLNAKGKRNATFVVYASPKQDLCEDDGLYAFEKGAGFSNPFCDDYAEPAVLLQLINVYLSYYST